MKVKGNAESLYYSRNEETQKLETITKEIASDIEFTLEDNEIVQTKYFKKSEGKTFPPSEFPKNEKQFKGFIWRGDEQPKVMEDIFVKDKTVTKQINPENTEVQKTRETLWNENKKKGKLKEYKFKPKTRPSGEEENITKNKKMRPKGI